MVSGYYTSIIPSTDYHYHRTEVGQCHPKMCLAVYSSMCMLHPWHGAVLVQGFIIMESLWYELFTWWNFSWLLMIKLKVVTGNSIHASWSDASIQVFVKTKQQEIISVTISSICYHAFNLYTMHVLYHIPPSSD